tara:strand:+ start:143 stop:526 length:384 start_codon:yes stop_codon:yes gene_type:complete
MNNICLLPVSIGELYDKYTILQIKLDKIQDIEKRKFLIKEYNLLSSEIEKHPLEETIIIELKEINLILWNIEDKIREKEQDKCFDDLFIELARSVYKNNDRRNIVKNKISLKFHSDLMDIKSYTEYS